MLPPGPPPSAPPGLPRRPPPRPSEALAHPWLAHAAREPLQPAAPFAAVAHGPQALQLQVCLRRHEAELDARPGEEAAEAGGRRGSWGRQVPRAAGIGFGREMA